MSLDDVAKSVVKKGKVEADKILKDGGKEVLLILSNVDGEVKALIEESTQKATKDIAIKREQEISSTEVDARRKTLMAEKDVLEQVKRKSFERLISAPRDKKEDILRRLVSKAGTVFPNGSIFCNSEDSEFIKRNAPNYNFEGSIDCAGGIVVENADNTERIDLTYETILEDVWEEQIGVVADKLFK